MPAHALQFAQGNFKRFKNGQFGEVMQHEREESMMTQLRSKRVRRVGRGDVGEKRKNGQFKTGSKDPKQY